MESEETSEAPTQRGSQIHTRLAHCQREPRMESSDLEFQLSQTEALQLEFQDSALSPALSLLPVTSAVGHNFTESFLQQSEVEFAPLRAILDTSTASEKFYVAPQDCTAHSLGHNSLSQHPLAQATVLSDDASCKEDQDENTKVTLSSATVFQQGAPFRENITSGEKESETQSSPTETPKPDVDDEILFLNENIPAEQLLDLLEKEVGMQSSSNSAISCSVTGSDEHKKAEAHNYMLDREGHPSEDGFSQEQGKQLEVRNLTNSCNPQTDNGSKVQCSELQRCEKLKKDSSPTCRAFTPPVGVLAQGKSSEKHDAERLRRGSEPWLSQTHMGADESYLGYLPQSQSTPAIFFAPSKFNVKATFGQLALMESNKESSGISSEHPVSPAEALFPDAVSQYEEDITSLPSLNYIQKINAWRAKPSSERSSSFESLTLPEPPGRLENKADEPLSNILNHTSAQPVEALQQLSPQSTNPKDAQTSSSGPSGCSSPRRGEAVGCARSVSDNKGSTASTFGRSQSHSSISTVLSVHKNHQMCEPSKQSIPKSQENVYLHYSMEVQPLHFTSLGQFSDVSLDHEQTLSSSLGSYNDIKVGTCVETSSAVSLELDNYAPYWTSKQTTPLPPSGPQELNIDERIPLYLQNLGIDQSPSKILTPFAPRGPIREPEFSPTDFCTIKGSSGSPSKSTQPSEGSSPSKGEFSKSSILSVDSSISVPLSCDSLGPAVSLPGPATARSLPSSETEAVQSGDRLAPTEFDNYSFILHAGQERQDNRQSSIDQNANVFPAEDIRDLNITSSSFLSVDKSFVSTSALSDICQPLSQADNPISTGSSTATTCNLLNDENIFKSPKRNTRNLQGFSLPSGSNVEEVGTLSSPPWPRSSPVSTLTSEQKMQNSVSKESMASASKLVKDISEVNRVGQFLDISKSARRTEPEGCSAATPDKAPKQLQVITSSSAASLQLPNPAPADSRGVLTEEEKTTHGSPEAQSRPSSPVPLDSDQGVLSDGSSESWLAARVAKLLQKEPPATMMSCTSSVTDQNEGKLEDWFKLTVSGEREELVELNSVDRRQIEEIKKELLLRNPSQSQGHPDTESSAASKDGSIKSSGVAQSAIAVSKVVGTNEQQILSLGPENMLHLDLEARVCEIAAREGLSFPIKKPRVVDSLSRRIYSPSSSTSLTSTLSVTPEPLHLMELSTAMIKPPITDSQLRSSLDEDGDAALGRLAKNPDPGKQQSQHSEEAQSEQQPKLMLQLECLDKTSPFSPHEESSVQASALCSVDQNAVQAASLSNVSLAAGTVPSSCSKVSVGTCTSALHTATELTHKDVLTIRSPTPVVSSPDEGVGSSSPLEWADRRETALQRERPDTSGAFTTAEPLLDTAKHRPEAVPAFITTDSKGKPDIAELVSVLAGAESHWTNTSLTAAPVLLPYKPKGSKELFYIPADDEQSDTTKESSHPGSDDAVPPRFSSEVLGNQDPGLDRGVTFRHKEGIYSKRLKTAFSRMQDATHTDNSAADGGSHTVRSRSPSSLVSGTFTKVSPLRHSTASKRDQGTSPVRFQMPVPHAQEADDLQQASSSLDHLWQKFCHQRVIEESRPSSGRELLKRLERLSRLIHQTEAAEGSRGQESVPHPEQPIERMLRRTDGGEASQKIRRDTHEPVSKTELKRGTAESGAGKDCQPSSSSSSSHSYPQSPHLPPGAREQSEMSSLLSSSMSSVDTARLVRVFGAHRVQSLNSSSSLSKLHSTINRQREEREQWRGRIRDANITTVSETTSTEESVAPDSASTSSTTQPHCGPPRTRMGIKVVNKGVQAGDVEVVSSGTRRHTRDVGTTFPSPAESQIFEQNSLSSSTMGSERGQRGFSMSHSFQKQRRTKRSPSKSYPKGVSWFISVDNPESERKENLPEVSPAERPSTAWFEPYSRVYAWRAPLRQKQVHDGHDQPCGKSQSEWDCSAKNRLSGLGRVSLQEALQMHRPDFISRSTWRQRYLALQVKERKLQANFTRDRNMLFKLHGFVERPSRPAGTALLRRAVPRKEMLQRSRQIYETLPEVQQKRDEARRKAEYQSYRLNAQLYNKRITNRVLGRRSVWQ